MSKNKKIKEDILEAFYCGSLISGVTSLLYIPLIMGPAIANHIYSGGTFSSMNQEQLTPIISIGALQGTLGLISYLKLNSPEFRNDLNDPYNYQND